MVEWEEKGNEQTRKYTTCQMLINGMEKSMWDEVGGITNLYGSLTDIIPYDKFLLCSPSLS